MRPAGACGLFPRLQRGLVGGPWTAPVPDFFPPALSGFVRPSILPNVPLVRGSGMLLHLPRLGAAADPVRLRVPILQRPGAH